MGLFHLFRKKKRAAPRRGKRPRQQVEPISQDIGEQILREIKALYLLLSKHDIDIKQALPHAGSKLSITEKLVLTSAIHDDYNNGMKGVEIVEKYKGRLSKSAVYRILQQEKQKVKARIPINKP